MHTPHLTRVFTIALTVFIYLSGGYIYRFAGDIDHTLIVLILILIWGVLSSVTIVLRYLTARKLYQVRLEVNRSIPDLPVLEIIPISDFGFALFWASTAFIGDMILWRVVPSPAYAIIALFNVLWMALNVSLKRLINRIRKPKGVFLRGYVSELLIGLIYLISFSLFVPSLAQFLWFNDPTITLFSEEAGMITLFVIVFYLIRYVNRIELRPIRQIYRVLGYADYSDALNLVEKERASQPMSLNLLVVQSIIYSYNNQLENAIVVLKKSILIATFTSVSVSLVNICNLGYTLLWQMRYSEAQLLFELVANIDATTYLPYLGLAEIYLLQGIEIERAINLLEISEANIKARKKRDKQNWAEILVLRAWIRTLQKRPIEADEFIRQALAETSQTFKPSLAILNYRIGQIMVMRGDKAQAIHYFQESHGIDPNGVYAQPSIDAVVALDKVDS